MEGWRECEELEPKSKEKPVFVVKKLVEAKSHKKIPLHEMRKETETKNSKFEHVANGAFGRARDGKNSGPEC